MSSTGSYWYRNGFNPAAVIATVVGAAVAIVPVLWTTGPGMKSAAQYTWFIGMALGFGVHALLSRRK